MKQFANKQGLCETSLEFSRARHPEHAHSMQLVFDMDEDAPVFRAWLIEQGYDLDNLTADGSGYDLG